MAFARLTIQETVQIPVPTPYDLCDSEEEVNSYCRDCAQKLCDVCKKSHLRSTTNREHVVVHISEGLSVDDEPTICHEHKSTLTFYFRSCDSLSCPKCLTKHHNGHNFTDTDEYANEVKNRLQSLISNKEKEKEEKRRELKIVTEAQENYLKEMDASKRKVKQTIKETRHEIQSIETELLSEINQAELKGQTIFEDERKRITGEESHLNGSIQKLRNDSTKEDNVLLIRAAANISKEASKDKKKLSLLVPVADLSQGRQKDDLKRATGNLQIRSKNYTGGILKKVRADIIDYCRCGFSMSYYKEHFRRYCNSCHKPKLM